MGGGCIHKEYWDIITEFAKQCLNRFQDANPIASGIEKEELKSRLTEHFYLKDAKRSEELFQELVKRGIVTVSGSTAALNGYTGGCSGELSGMMEAIRERYRLAGVEAPTIDEVINGFKDKKQARQIITELVRQDALVKAAPASIWENRNGKRRFLSSKTIWIRILISHLQSTGIFWEPPENMQSCCWMHLTSAR